MNLQDFNAPVRYEPPKSGRGRPANLKPILISARIVTGLVVIILLVVLSKTTQHLKQTGWLPDTPKPLIVADAPLAWRELGKVSSFGPVGGYLVVGDFSGKGDDELFVTDPNLDQATIYTLDGESRQLSGWKEKLKAAALAWDYDRDGIAEVLDAGNEEVRVYNLKGKLLETLPFCGWPVQTAEVDGDGQQELIVIDTEVGEVKALGRKGRLIRRYGKFPRYSHWCDWDGNGVDEMICQLTERNFRAVFYDDDWEDFTGPEYCTIMDDFRADTGVPKLVAVVRPEMEPGDERVSILIPNSSEIILRLPEVPGEQTAQEFISNFMVYAVNFKQGAGQQVAVVRGGFGIATSVILCGLGGQQQYYEEFGEQVQGAGVAVANDHEHLAILTNSRLLVCP